MSRHPRGFTLIEVLIVVMIVVIFIGILAVFATPNRGNGKQRGYRTQAIAELTSLRTAEETFFADSNRYAQLSELTAFSSTTGLGMPLIVKSKSYWSATLTHPQLPGVVCGVALATVNPVQSSAGDGEPFCK